MSWNNIPISILLANGDFMGVAILSENGILEFAFYPRLFYFLVRITFFLAGILTLIIF